MLRRIVFGFVVGTLSATTAFAQAARAAAARRRRPSARVVQRRTAAWCSISSRPTRPPISKTVIGKLKEALAEEREARAQAAGGQLEGLQVAGPGRRRQRALRASSSIRSVKGADYTVSTILAEAFPTEVQALYKQYAEAYASGQNFVNLSLGLAELAQASVRASDSVLRRSGALASSARRFPA